MKIKTKRKSLKPIVITIVAVALVAGAAVAYMYATKQGLFNNPTKNEESQKQQANNTDTQNSQKKEDISADSKSENVDTRKTIDEIPVSTSLSVSIDSLTQDSNGVVAYKATSTGNQKGTCSATFTNDIGKPVVRNSETTDGTCSAEIPALEFDALGEWTLTLRYYANNTQAVATKTLEVK